MAILLSGRGSNMQALVAAAHAPECPFEIVLVLSDTPDAPGIGWAADRGLATATISRHGTTKADHEAAIDRALRAAGAQVIALAGFMRILSGSFVERWAGQIVNIHPSLLPKYKGLDTHARAIAAGDSIAGCSVHLVTEHLDAGDVLGQADVPILADDTPETLAARVLAAEHRLYPRVLAQFAAR